MRRFQTEVALPWAPRQGARPPPRPHGFPLLFCFMPPEVHGPRIAAEVSEVAARVEKFRNRRIGEQNTKTSLIEPILASLGWDIHDPDEVFKEYKAKPSDKPVDYALKLMREPRLLLEAKGLGENLSDRKWVAQVVSYASVAGVKWCVLTDGDEYRFYNSMDERDAEKKLFCRVRLTQDKPEQIHGILSLLARDQLQEDLLEQFWKAHHVDRQVKAALENMVGTADSGLVRLVRKQAPKLQPKQIAQSLRRLDIQIEAPSPTRTVLKAEDPAPEEANGRKPEEPRAKAARRQSRKRSAPRQIKVSLRDLLDAGLLSAPLQLRKTYKGQELAATVLPTGEVEVAGKTFESCSAAAAFAQEAATGKGRPTNGWEFWAYESGGRTRNLAQARSEFLDKNHGESE